MLFQEGIQGDSDVDTDLSVTQINIYDKFQEN